MHASKVAQLAFQGVHTQYDKHFQCCEPQCLCVSSNLKKGKQETTHNTKQLENQRLELKSKAWENDVPFRTAHCGPVFGFHREHGGGP